MDLSELGYEVIKNTEKIMILKHDDKTYLAITHADKVKFSPFYRKPDERFLQACRRELEDAMIVCNGPYFTNEGTFIAYANPYWLLNGNDVSQIGRVYIDGAHQADSNASPSMFFVNQSESGYFTFGEGEAAVPYNMISGLTPVTLSTYRVLDGFRSPLSFGGRNLYDDSAEASHPREPTGQPNRIHTDNLIQKSFSRYRGLGAGTGMTAMGINRQNNWLVVLGRNDGEADEVSEHEHKSALSHFLQFECTDAVAFDVSTSCTMMTSEHDLVSPDPRKNRSVEVEFKISWDG